MSRSIVVAAKTFFVVVCCPKKGEARDRVQDDILASSKPGDGKMAYRTRCVGRPVSDASIRAIDRHQHQRGGGGCCGTPGPRPSSLQRPSPRPISPGVDQMRGRRKGSCPNRTLAGPCKDRNRARLVAPRKKKETFFPYGHIYLEGSLYIYPARDSL